MAKGCEEIVFQEAFRHIGRDEGRHMAICMALMERDYPNLTEQDKDTITKQIRAGYLFLSAVLFEPPVEFWDLPDDFIPVQQQAEAVARAAGFGIPSRETKLENWRNAMLNLKGSWIDTTHPSRQYPKSALPAKRSWMWKWTRSSLSFDEALLSYGYKQNSTLSLRP